MSQGGLSCHGVDLMFSKNLPLKGAPLPQNIQKMRRHEGILQGRGYGWLS